MSEVPPTPAVAPLTDAQLSAAYDLPLPSAMPSPGTVGSWTHRQWEQALQDLGYVAERHAQHGELLRHRSHPTLIAQIASTPGRDTSWANFATEIRLQVRSAWQRLRDAVADAAVLGQEPLPHAGETPQDALTRLATAAQARIAADAAAQQAAVVATTRAQAEDDPRSTAAIAQQCRRVFEQLRTDHGIGWERAIELVGLPPAQRANADIVARLRAAMRGELVETAWDATETRERYLDLLRVGRHHLRQQRADAKKARVLRRAERVGERAGGESFLSHAAAERHPPAYVALRQRYEAAQDRVADLRQGTHALVRLATDLRQLADAFDLPDLDLALQLARTYAAWGGQVGQLTDLVAQARAHLRRGDADAADGVLAAVQQQLGRVVC
jgi:hypothetical protein